MSKAVDDYKEALIKILTADYGEKNNIHDCSRFLFSVSLRNILESLETFPQSARSELISLIIDELNQVTGAMYNE
jgi:hypothetical protein